MDFYDALLTTGLSIISGIVGGWTVFWSFKGIHFFGGGIRLNNEKFLERYVLKYSFILAISILAALVLSLIAFLLNETLENLSFINYLSLSFVILCFIFFTILLKWKKPS